MAKFAGYLEETRVWVALLVPVLALVWATQIDRPTPTQALLQAAQSGDVPMLQSALSAGVEADVTDEVGFTPLMIAARAGNLQAVRYLLDQGANIDARTPVCGTALMQAALYGRDDVLHLLLARQADPNCRTDFGQTALWYAIEQQSPSPAIIRQLIDAGADPDLPCSRGDTARAAAARSKDPTILQALRQTTMDSHSPLPSRGVHR